MINILLAEDDVNIRDAIKLSFAGENFNFTETSTIAETQKFLSDENIDLILLDIHLEDGSSVDFLKSNDIENLSIPVIVFSGAANAKEAADAIKYGAYDFLEKPISADKLQVTINRAIEHFKFRNIAKSFSNNSNLQNSIIGNSDEIIEIKKTISEFAIKDVKVLITGETGTGKEVIAHEIWKQSSRNKKPFIIVNCAAIPENLIESELFGHKKGAFTGAISDQIGKIELATNGTLFLDEIGELSIAAQTKLLRFLETGEVQKLGSSIINKHDVRIIAATSRNIGEEMTNGHFRSDLYYRLNVLNIKIPALRERKEDIPLLFNYFISQFSQKFNRSIPKISREAYEYLATYEWPGNIRELRNIAEKSLVLSKNNISQTIIEKIIPKQNEAKQSQIFSPDNIKPLREARAEFEKDYIQKVLQMNKGSITNTAKVLKVDRTYLHQKLSKLEVER